MASHAHSSAPILNRMPSLGEVLSRRTRPPVDLFCFYLFLQREGSEDALDFWLDVQQHENLCRAYFKDIRKSGRSVADAWPAYWDQANRRGSVYAKVIGLGSSGPYFPSSDADAEKSPAHPPHTPEPPSPVEAGRRSPTLANVSGLRRPSTAMSWSRGHRTSHAPTVIPRSAAITHDDLYASAERIFVRYLAGGSEKEIYLPPSLRVHSFPSREDGLEDIPDLFHAQKEYVFRALEGGVYPRFLRAKGFGNLTPVSSLVRLALGLFFLWFAFTLAFTFIFLDYKPQRTRVWVILPFFLASYCLLAFRYDLDPLLVLFNQSETTPFRTIGIEEPYIKKLLVGRSALVIGLITLLTAALTVLFVLVPGHRL